MIVASNVDPLTCACFCANSTTPCEAVDYSVQDRSCFLHQRILGRQPASCCVRYEYTCNSSYTLSLLEIASRSQNVNSENLYSMISSNTSICYGLFTPPTQTRQNCLVLSAVVFTPPLRRDKKLCRVSNYVHTTNADSSKLARDETKLSCQRRDHNWRPHKTVLSRCIGGVNKPLLLTLSFSYFL